MTYHLQLKSDISARAGDLLIVDDLGNVTVSKSIRFGDAIREATLPPLPVEVRANLPIPQPATRQVRHHYSVKRRLVLRSATQVSADRDRVLAIAAQFPDGSSVKQAVDCCYGKNIAAMDKRATQIRDDVRYLHGLGLLERIGENPTTYRVSR